jgi:hypothetical protein
MAIAKINVIASDTPTRQVWRYLRYFLDNDCTAGFIRRFHNLKEGEQTQNVHKQACHVAFAIRQAEEYFAAADRSSLATRPTLQYYGLVSLSKALTLLRLDGSYSFDALRTADRHNHHGLEFDRSKLSRLGATNSLEELLSLLICTPYRKVLRGAAESKTATNREPWGHFALFMRSLVPAAVAIAQKNQIEGQPTSLEDYHAAACANIPSVEDVFDRMFNCASLIKTLPDLFEPLRECGINPGLRRGKAAIYNDVKHIIDSDGTSHLSLQKLSHTFAIDAGSIEAKVALVKFYQQKNPAIEVIADIGAQTVLRISKSRVEGEEGYSLGYYPDLVDSMLDQLFFILDPASYLPESVSMFCTVFCFGMLARYFPDVWMNLLDRNVRFTELSNTLFEIVHRKFPLLMLDQMTLVKHHFSRV